MQCPYCQGTKRDPESPMLDCPECGGDGVVEEED